ncbi:MAG: beta-ketoacyl synthase N-terminal-like domain-containing protein, partial [Jatrophihabitantaceae bacterium]
MTSTTSLRNAHRPAHRPTTLFDLVRQHQAARPQATAYTFQPGRGEAEQSWSWTDLDRRSRAIAVQLQQAGMRGRPVLVLQPAGLEYVACFLGCLYAGAIAVPAYPPDSRRMGQSLARLAAIVADSRTTLALTTSAVRGMALAERARMATIGLAELTWLATDTVDDEHAGHWQRPSGEAGQLALLQYTSGSTATPKGVMVSNANLLANLDSIHRRLGHDQSSGMVSWLPPFHDMGLIGGILSPLYGGFAAHLMAPETFVAKPLRWLDTLSRTGASTSVAPNFGFEHCLRRITQEDKASLDLSQWRLALNGAEPIRAETLTRFAAYFADCGFEATALLPCYGLAEASLMVTGERAELRPRVRTLDGVAMSAGRARPATAAGRGGIRVVSCGTPVDDVEVRIVDPDLATQVADAEVGEIWVSGPSVARGYWRRPEESARTFRAVLEGTDGWLRTGDLGFLQDGQLHVVGRIKDLVILSGRNIYPHDVEQAVEACHPAIRSGAVAAFGIEVAGTEQLIVAAEVETRQLGDPGSALAAIRAALAKDHDVSPHAVVLIRRSSLPKTTSGKIQRQSCRSAFLQLQLDVVAASVLTDLTGRSDGPVSGQLLATTISRAVGRSVGLAELRAAHSLAELSVDYPCVLQTIAALGPKLRADFQPSELLKARSGNDLLACFGVADDALTSAATMRPRPGDPASAAALEDWLRSAVARRLAVPMESVPVDTPMQELGLDSKSAVAITDELARRLRLPVSAALVFDHPTIRALSAVLAGDDPARPDPNLRQPARATAGSPGHALTAESQPSNAQIAIVGIGCRLPGAADARAYWDLLRDGREGIGPVPASRWDAAAAGTPSRGGFLDDPAAFDALLFGISRREADWIDPQQRLMLEVSWQALEDAGVPATDLRGSDTGVYVGISSSDYAELSAAAGTASDLHGATGNAHALAANRISYNLDLRGPSMAIDTACSSSLVAVHLAVRALQAGECSFALAGGVNLTLTPGLSAAFARAGMLAPDGTCRAFDDSAAGYVRGEGAAVVCLKRLPDAMAAGDRIYGVIRGSAVGHGGRANGITAPSSVAQERVIRAALANAGLDAAAVNYVEAHGTGTSLGDPIEWESLARVYGAGDRSGPCTVGSVKPAIGHLEAAAGIAGLVKAVLVLHHGLVPAQRNFHVLNSRMAAAQVPLTVAAQQAALPEHSRVAVSSFGFGGANAHLVLEAAPVEPEGSIPARTSRTAHALALSGHTPSALATLAQRWRLHLAADPAPLADLCATNNAGRSHLAHRAVLIAGDRAELDSGLASLAVTDGAPAEASVVRGTVDHAAQVPRLAMLFSGQGSQYPGMGRALYEAHSGFAASLDESDAILRPLLGQSLLDLVLRSEDAAVLRRTRFCQPALVAFEIALLRLWASLGIQPAAVLGHSVGAFAAAHAAGVLRAEDAVTLAAVRGRLMDEQPGDGAMLACSGDDTQIRSVAD